ncbi:MAG: TonB family protein [Verrucomicrobia bacterium]|nr:TonB family protein [Verrucomicrobiota bacterium]
MSHKPNVGDSPPDLKTEFPVSLTTAMLFTAAVILALPLTQVIESVIQRTPPVVTVTQLPPPPIPPIPPPPQEEEIQEDIRDIQEDRTPPSLALLELALNPDLSGLVGSGVSVHLPDIQQDIDDLIFELRDLTRQPSPIAQPSPIYPPELQRNRIEGNVTIQFVVRPDGSVDRAIVERSTNPGFDEAALRAVRRWRFTPPEKDGQAVSVRMRVNIPFTVSAR